jgi:glycosyltransferase involved in cell wall biosynthesis
MSPAQPTRVLVISFSAAPAPDRQGVEVDALLRALAPRFQVDALTIRTAEMGYVERYHRCRMLRVPVGSGDRTDQVETFRRAVRRQLEGTEYDVVHVRSAYGGRVACELKEFLDCRLVFDLGLTSSSERSRLGPEDLRVLAEDEQLCLARADLVITHSEAAASALAGHSVAAPVAVVPPGVDIDMFDWEPAAAKATRRLVFVGTLAPGRGIRLLLDAFRQLLDYFALARLALVGPVEPGFAPYLEQAIGQLHLDRHVDVLGPVDREDLPRLMCAADLGICPWAPDPERQPLASPPLALLELMACRRPVIAPAVSTLQQRLGPAAVKWFIPDDARDLATSMLQLLADAPVAERIAEAGYAEVRQHFTAAISRRELLAAYSQLVPSTRSVWWRDAFEGRAGTSAAGSGSDRFHDTAALAEIPTSTSEPGSTASQRRPFLSSGETWILRAPEAPKAAEAGARADADDLAEPEFVAAGELLGDRVARHDTNPETLLPEPLP